LNYHLTFSFDGWDNAQNLKIASNALAHGVNVAAAFNLKKNRPMFKMLEGGNALSAQSIAIVDGDSTDYRPSDPKGGHIVGLRFKLPHGIKYTPAQKMAFCIA
jgi:hypothetical protein